MRRVVRQNNGGRNAGPGAPAPATTPNTPRKDGASLDKLIQALEDEFQFGLLHQGLRSPRELSSTLTGKVYGQIQRLHWVPEPVLENVLGSFRRIATASRPEKPLELLNEMLKDERDRLGLSSSSRAKPSNTPARTLESSSRGSPHARPSPGVLQLHRKDGPSALETNLSRDENTEEDIPTPPSPTMSSMSAKRRIQQASPHAHFALEPVGRKRTSDSSHGSSSARKLTKTLKGKQPVDTPSDQNVPNTSPSANLFKKPSLDMARSFQTDTTASANVSFNSAWSSDQAQPGTAATSFSSDDICYPDLTARSFIPTVSLDDQQVEDQIARERDESERRRLRGLKRLTQGSSSTFDSIDDNDLLEASLYVEAGPSKPVITPPVTSKKIALQPRPLSEPAESPSKLAWFIRDIPKQHLFVEELSEDLKKFTYFILFICCRVSNETGISMEDLMHGMVPADVQSDSSTFWEILANHSKVTTKVRQEPVRVWSAAKQDFEGYTFKGRVVFNHESKSVFKLQLSLIEQEKSCRLQRKFGSGRFLYLNLPPFEVKEKTRQKSEGNTKRRFDGKQMRQIEEQWKVWMNEEHCFLGRTWRAFHLEPIKTNKRGNRSKEDNSNRRLVMFATKGIGLQPISLREMLNWFFPFDGNLDQSFCKAYARLDLALSRTIPTLTFKPSQIRRVDDILSDGTPEDSRFNDPVLRWDQAAASEVMNDGCARISVGAALKIWRAYCEITHTKNQPLPSVFQGRIGGAKGLWMVCSEPSTIDPKELDIWIEITPSQRKFEAHLEDQSDDQFDEFRTTFDLLRYSSKPSSSDLHALFIPILVDRGVPQHVIASMINNHLDAERGNLLEMLSNPANLHSWIHKSSPAITGENPLWQAAIPHSLPIKISLLLRSGFSPVEEPFLANMMKKHIKEQQRWSEQMIKIPFGKSSYLLGVADPLGVLAPGQVHVEFSAPFDDESSGITYRDLNNMELLVARQPACRRSDIQKVRAIKHPELSFLVDVVVFPSKGRFPLAGKLQGGDYDGDVFWVTWESALVQPFKNAPAPLAKLDHAKYGIKQDTRSLHEVMTHGNGDSVDSFLKEALEFRMIPSCLGLVTDFLENKAYEENRIYSEKLDALCDVHDLLVDAAKSGFRFSNEDYEKLVRYKLRCGSPNVPAYKEAMKDCAAPKEQVSTDQVLEKRYKQKKDNLMDYLYFEVVRKHNASTLQSINEALCKDESDDSDLRYPLQFLRESGSKAVKAELDSLATHIRDINSEWGRKIAARTPLTSGDFSTIVDTCYAKYRSLMPSNTGDPDVKPLLENYLNRGFSVWEYVRASALHSLLPTGHSFVWQMAGRELAKLKAESMPGVNMIPGIFANLKPKPVKAPRLEEYEDESDSGFESALEYVSS